MGFEHVHASPHAARDLFVAHRDSFAEIAARLDDIDTIEALERRIEGDRVTVVNRWTGRRSALPWLLRPLVPADALQWVETTTFDPDTLACVWQIEVPAVGDLMTVEGTHGYATTPTGTDITLQGELLFNPEAERARVPPTAIPYIQRMVSALIVPLLAKSGPAMDAHLQAIGGSPSPTKPSP